MNVWETMCLRRWASYPPARASVLLEYGQVWGARYPNDSQEVKRSHGMHALPRVIVGRSNRRAPGGVLKVPSMGFSNTLLQGRIGYFLSVEPRERREVMRFGVAPGVDLQDGELPGDERIGDERPIAAPRKRLGADDDDGTIALGEVDELLKSLYEHLHLHVIGEAAKPGVSPSEID